MKKDAFKPKYRYPLRAKISEVGYRTITAYAEDVGVDLARISRIVSGWELPSLRLARKMAKALGITIKEFGDLI